MHLALELPGKGLVRSREGRHEQVASASTRRRPQPECPITSQSSAAGQSQSRRLQARGKPDCSAR